MDPDGFAGPMTLERFKDERPLDYQWAVAE
jgi:hypothetical protein